MELYLLGRESDPNRCVYFPHILANYLYVLRESSHLASPFLLDKPLKNIHSSRKNSAFD